MLPGSRPSPSGSPSTLPYESVIPPSNQHSAPADIPAITTPASQASRRIVSIPCARQIASMLTVFPPPT